MMLVDLLWALATGLAGSLHCFGMCGPLAIAYSLDVRKEPGQVESRGISNPFAAVLIRHHLIFQCGRIMAYGVTGLAAATLVYFVGSSQSFQDVRVVISLLGGCLMIALGLTLLGVIRVRWTDLAWAFSRGERKGDRGAAGMSPAFSGRMVTRLLRSRQRLSGLLIGFAAGFLPCMLSWAMVARAAATGDAIAGALIMVSFGIGTAPALLFTGFFASFFTVRMRLAGERMAALSVLAMGLFLVWKGVRSLV